LDCRNLLLSLADGLENLATSCIVIISKHARKVIVFRICSIVPLFNIDFLFAFLWARHLVLIEQLISSPTTYATLPSKRVQKARLKGLNLVKNSITGSLSDARKKGTACSDRILPYRCKRLFSPVVP